MKTIRLRSYINESGLLQVQLPDHHNEEVEILIVYQPIQKNQKRQWSQSFLNLFGAWKGEPLVREPQGHQPEREQLF